MKSIIKDQGFILKITPVKARWAYITIFTKDNWKMSYFIANIKKSKTIFSSYLTIWNEIEIIYIRKSTICYVKDVKLINNIWIIGFEKLVILSYILEISNKITVDDNQNTEFYELIAHSLEFIIKQNNLLKICLIFEIKLLTIFWYLCPLNFYIDSNKKINLDSTNKLSEEFGWIIEELNPNQKNVNYLRAHHIKTFYFIQHWNYIDIIKLKITHDDFKNELYIFRNNIIHHLSSKNKINPCFLNENVLQ